MLTYPSQASRRYPSLGSVEERLAELRAELEASVEPRRRAALLFMVGHLLERRVGDVSQAVKAYLQAFNESSDFRPPLYSLIRIFESRHSVTNLVRLYEALISDAKDPNERALALTELGNLFYDQLQRVDDAANCYLQALETSGELSAPALMWERIAWRANDAEQALTAVEFRATRTADVELKRILMLEVADAKAKQGAPEMALSLINQTLEFPGDRLRSFRALERLAREHTHHEDVRGQLLRALEGQAERISDSFLASSKTDVSDDARARIGAEVSAIWRDAGYLTWQKGEFAKAIAHYDRALMLTPDDALTRIERSAVHAAAGQHQAAADDARILIKSLRGSKRDDEGALGMRALASIHVRVAEQERLAGRANTYRDALDAAIAADPSSALAPAMLEEHLVREGLHADRIEFLVERARRAEPEGRAQMLWYAAHIAADWLKDWSAAAVLFAKSADAFVLGPDFLRAAAMTALRFRDYGEAKGYLLKLLDVALDDDEHSATAFLLYELARRVLDDPALARDVLVRSLDDARCGAWAPENARVYAARYRDFDLLAKAHERLASLVGSSAERNTHRAMAARAWIWAGESKAAMPFLNAILEHDNNHPFALGLLENVLTREGKGSQFVDLLGQSASKHAGGQLQAKELLLAATIAEENETPSAKVVELYKRAIERTDNEWSAWLLKHYAMRINDEEALRFALQSLADSEVRIEQAGRACFEFASFLEERGEYAAAAKWYGQTLGNETWQREAALAIHTLPFGDDSSLRARAALAYAETLSSMELRQRWLEEAAIQSQDAQLDLRIAEALLQVEDAANQNWWLAWINLKDVVRSRDLPAQVQAWEHLARVVHHPKTKRQLWLLALESATLADGEIFADKSKTLIDRILSTTEPDALNIVAQHELAWQTGELSAYAEAYAQRIKLSDDVSASTRAAFGRSASLLGQKDAALEALQGLVHEDPEDWASWECLRTTARDCGQWSLVVDACQRLAAACDEGLFRAQLLEEAAVVLQDHFEETDRAQRLFEEVFLLDARLTTTFLRLRDLYAAQMVFEKLISLTRRRIEVIDDAEQLARLYYELARFYRAENVLYASLGALDQLFLLEPEHAGGLALKADVHITQEDWDNAVETLAKLANANIPAAQRRIALLGAADLLEERLHRPADALEYLRSVVNTGLVDAALFERMAKVAEKARRLRDAAVFWQQAASMSTGESRARQERRAGALYAFSVKDIPAAIQAYRAALQAAPTDLRSGQALIELLHDGDERQQMIARFEDEVRIELASYPLESTSLRKLMHVAQWRDDNDLELAVQEVLARLGVVDEFRKDSMSDEGLAIRASASATQPVTTELWDALWLENRPPVETTIVQVTSHLIGLAEKKEHKEWLADYAEKVGKRNFANADFALEHVLGLFSLKLESLYHSSRIPIDIDALVVGTDIDWVIAEGIGFGAPVLFRAGLLAMGQRYGAGALTRKTPQEMSWVIEAASRIGGAQWKVPPIPEVQAWQQRFEAVISRKARAALQNYWGGVEVPHTRVGELTSAVAYSTSCAGMLITGQFNQTLEYLLGVRPTRETIEQSAICTRIVKFWYSPLASVLRRALGTHAP